MIKIEKGKTSKNFKITDYKEVIIKGLRPKWYSPEIRFFYNNKTYEIKKKGFWSASFIIMESGRQIGEIRWSFKTGSKIILRNNNSSHQYWLKTEQVGKWYGSDRNYILNEDGETPILTIHYTQIKWKEVIEAEFNSKDNSDYLLLTCAWFVMRQQRKAENAAASGGAAY